jgi:thioredoxin 1
LLISPALALRASVILPENYIKDNVMKNVLIVVVLLVAIGAVIATKQLKSTMEPKPDGDVKVTENNNVAVGNEATVEDEARDNAVEVAAEESTIEENTAEAASDDGAMEAAAIAITEKVLAETKLPRLLELGSVSCIPCKKMKPILDELEVEYAGSMKVEFIDVWQDTSAGKKYGIDLIPTQIFFDADGKELFRHEGFYPKEKILAKWKEHGIEFRIELTEVK